MVRVRVHARDDAREGLRLARIENRKRVVRIHGYGDDRSGRESGGYQAAGCALDVHSHETPLSLMAETVYRTSLIEAEDILALRLLHALLEILLPIMGPWAAVHIGNLVLDDRARRNRRRTALQGEDRLHAVDEDV